MEIKIQLINPDDNENIQTLANWYLNEWNIPIDTSIKKLKTLSKDAKEFQFLMIVDNEPVATGGIYQHVGLLDKVPRLSIYKNWLALLYTLPNHRKKGYGELLCKRIQIHAKKLELKNIYLFTHTSENLYKKLNWELLERLDLGGKDIVVMKKNLLR